MLSLSELSLYVQRKTGALRGKPTNLINKSEVNVNTGRDEEGFQRMVLPIERGGFQSLSLIRIPLIFLTLSSNYELRLYIAVRAIQIPVQKLPCRRPSMTRQKITTGGRS
jgi:hypothetical protein